MSAYILYTLLDLYKLPSEPKHVENIIDRIDLISAIQTCYLNKSISFQQLTLIRSYLAGYPVKIEQEVLLYTALNAIAEESRLTDQVFIEMYCKQGGLHLAEVTYKLELLGRDFTSHIKEVLL